MVAEFDEDNKKAQSLLAQLKEGSEYLENQQEALTKVWNTFNGKVFSFYETEKTISLKKVCLMMVARGVLRLCKAHQYILLQ